MRTKGVLRVLLILLLIVVNIGCDQVSKKIVRQNIAPYQIISALNNHLTVTNVENEGAFLSLGDSMPKTAKNIFLSALPLLVIAFVFYYTITRQTLSGTTVTGLCFIIGGGIGNIFDRVIHGSVTDFLHLAWGPFQTGIFNLADLSIVTGSLMILLNFFLKRKQMA